MVHTDFPRGVGYISVDGNQCRANGYLGVDVLSRETNPNLDKRMKPDWIDHSVHYARMCWSVETRLMMLPLLKKSIFFLLQIEQRFTGPIALTRLEAIITRTLLTNFVEKVMCRARECFACRHLLPFRIYHSVFRLFFSLLKRWQSLFYFSTLNSFLYLLTLVQPSLI